MRGDKFKQRLRELTKEATAASLAEIEQAFDEWLASTDSRDAARVAARAAPTTQGPHHD